MLRKLLMVTVFVILASVIFAAPITLYFWQGVGAAFTKPLQDLCNQFTALNPNVKVDVLYTGDYHETLTKTISAVQGGNPPDIVQIYDVGTQVMMDSGVIIPIQDMIDKDPSFDINTIIPAARNYYSYKGKLYSMPFNSSNPVIYYNKNLFEKAGLNPNDPPTTFDQFIADAQKLTVKDSSGNTIQYGFTFGTGQPIEWFFEQFLAIQDALYLNNNNGRTGRADKAVFDSPAGLRVLNFFNTMVQNGSAIVAGAGWDNARSLFLSQRAAMLIDSTANITMLLQGAGNKFNVGVMFLPHPSGVPYGGVIIGGASLWLINTHNTQREQAAWDLLKFLESTDAQAQWSAATGYFPINRNSIIKLLYQGFYAQHPEFLVAVLQLLMSTPDAATSGALSGAMPDIRTAVNNAFSNVFSKLMTPEQALQQAQNQANKDLANYNSLY
ncbi:MAG: ABC transporter substrate-binding protein [Candidatus Parvarchaeota archaeon]|nr:ABC transporter substrate-binding protein [Candidatus Jingweiarchaeum tengchongense]MCW1306158.1 ABC transporter substrate-binding protein [Candidatus Jingweiarchaeum tengchongense]